MAKIEFTGNLGRDAELRYTPSGRAVLNFSVGDSKSKKLENGDWETLAEQWLNCTVWGELAEFYDDKLKKGQRVTVYGEFYARKYEAKDGSTGTSLDVNVHGIVAWPARNGGGNRSAQESAAATGAWGNTGGDTAGWGNGPDSEPPF